MNPARVALAAAVAWGAYTWGAHLLPATSIRRGNSTQRRVALTFDDGPDPEWTPRILDVLARRCVPGTFFVVGNRAARAPDIVRRMAAEGHEVASHGWSHRSLWACGPRRTTGEIARTHELLATLSGREPRHFRPPWGMLNAAALATLRKRRLRCVLWSIQPEGLRPAPADRQVLHVLRRAHPGAIVDLHDAEGTPGAPRRLGQALIPMIEGLRTAGYQLVTVTELLD